MAKEMVLVAGKHPLDETAGRHSSYARAHAGAVIRFLAQC
jgi:hypothetical protein